MVQIKAILKRLRKPSVLISLAAEVIALVAMLNIDINKEYITQIVLAVTTILTTLGILDNPDSSKKGYGDDVMYCEHCGKETTFITVDGKQICSECGNKK